VVPLYARSARLGDGTLVRVMPTYDLQKIRICAPFEFMRAHLPKVFSRDEALLAEVAAIAVGKAIDPGDSADNIEGG
jgi:hypothetical protein